MQSNGIIKEWNDEKGFGFISYDKKQIFVHIKSFENRKYRPKVGQKVFFTISNDNMNRSCAINVKYLEDVQYKFNIKVGLVYSIVKVILFFIILLTLIDYLNISIVVFYLYMFMSFITFLVYYKDKKLAKINEYRIPENTLHNLSLFCGWPGAILAQQLLRHKSKKESFRRVFYVIIILNISIFVILEFTQYGNMILLSILKLIKLLSSRVFIIEN